MEYFTNNLPLSHLRGSWHVRELVTIDYIATIIIATSTSPGSWIVSLVTGLLTPLRITTVSFLSGQSPRDPFCHRRSGISRDEP